MIVISILISGCVENFNFTIKNDKSTIVVEALISDKSYFDIDMSPDHDGRFFYVKVSKTGNVNSYSSNGNKISNATVYIQTSDNKNFYYTNHYSGIPGVYVLYDKEFKAEEGIEYRLVVESEFGNYESSWESLNQSSNIMGNVCFEESSIFRNEYQADERVFVEQKTADFYIEIPAKPENNAGGPDYYLWGFERTYIYKAPLASSPEVETCYLFEEVSDFTIWKDLVGGYNHKIFHVETLDNIKINHALSMSISQYKISEDFYFFLQELQAQDERGGLYDTPPYNVRTNLNDQDGNLPAIGYFAVVKEEIGRVYFSDYDLSYYVPDYRKDYCLSARPPKPRDCLDCTKNRNADSQTRIKPSWWPLINQPSTDICK